MEAESPKVRERTLMWFDEAVSTRLNDFGRSAIIVVQQRVHESDLTGHILAKEMGWDHLNLPMRFEEDHPFPIRSRIGFVDPRSPAVPPEDRRPELLWPERMDEAAVRQLETTLGSYGASAQLQQRPIPRAGGLFERRWFPILNAAPEGGRVVRAWDLAATEKVGTGDPDWTVGVRMRRALDGTIIVEDVRRIRAKPGEVERLIREMASQDGRDVTIRLPEDPGQAGKSQTRYYAQQLQGYDCRFVRPTGSKATRAAPLAAQAEVGNVRLLRGAWNEAFLDELTVFPNGAHDDQVDAAAAAFDQLTQPELPIVQQTAYS